MKPDNTQIHIYILTQIQILIKQCLEGTNSQIKSGTGKWNKNALCFDKME